MKHKLEADSVHLKYGTREILSSVYLKLETGRITGLLGRNGTGKTSLIHILYGCLKGSHQFIRFDGHAVVYPFKVPGLISYLPQHHYIPASFTLKRVFTDFDVDYGLFEKQFAGFTGKYHAKIMSLSGGERRLVELFLLLKCNSKFVLLDEPFSHLSPFQTEQVKTLIKETALTKGVLITDHMYQHIIDVADDIYLLTDGHMRLIKDLQELEFFGYLKQVSLDL